MNQKTIVISQKDLKGISSGVQRKVHEEIKYFANQGHKVYVVSERINKEAVIKSGGIPYKTFRWPVSGYFRRLNYLNRTHKAIKKLKPDLVIGHGDIVEQDICYIHNCVHLAHEKIHGKPIAGDHEVGRIHQRILTEQKFKILVCNSNLMKNDLMKRFNIPEEKIRVIYPEYNPEKFNLDGRALREKFREEFNLEVDDVVIGLITSGNFKKRNLSLLIEVAFELKKQGHKFKVFVAGKDKTDQYLDKINELEMSDCFIFAPGISEVERYYHGIDIFVLPAHIEEFGRSALEAMGCGKPVIVSNMVGSSEILEGEAREYILKELTVSEFSKRLSDLICSKGVREQLGKKVIVDARKYQKEVKDIEFGELLENIFI